MGTNVLTTPNPIKPPSTSDPIPQVVAVSAEGWCPYVRRDVAGRLACRGTPSRGHTPQSALPVAGGWFGCFRILGGARATNSTAQRHLPGSWVQISDTGILAGDVADATCGRGPGLFWDPPKTMGSSRLPVTAPSWGISQHSVPIDPNTTGDHAKYSPVAQPVF